MNFTETLAKLPIVREFHNRQEKVVNNSKAVVLPLTLENYKEACLRTAIMAFPPVIGEIIYDRIRFGDRTIIPQSTQFPLDGSADGEKVVIYIPGSPLE